MLRFIRDIEQVGHAALHAERHFVLSNAGLDLGITEYAVALLVEFGEFIQFGPANFAGDAFGVFQVKDTFAFVA